MANIVISEKDLKKLKKDKNWVKKKGLLFLKKMSKIDVDNLKNLFK